MINTLFFHGGGFYALCHYVGTLRRLHHEYKKPNGWLSKDVKFYGNSAGALVALLCYMLLNDMITIEFIEKMVIGEGNIIDKPVPITFTATPIGFNILDYLVSMFPNDLHARIDDIVHIGITTRSGHRFLSNYKSNYDIYNAIACSGTVASASTYDSKIDGERCIDGEVSFAYNCLPRKTLVLECPIPFPICMLIPPIATRKYLFELGYTTVNPRNTVERYSRPGPWLSEESMEFWIDVHEFWYKNPMWNVHMMAKTGCISEVPLQINTFDLLHYVYNTFSSHGK